MVKPRRTIAVHPGEILQAILDQNQITQSQLADRRGMAQSKLNEICRAKKSQECFPATLFLSGINSAMYFAQRAMFVYPIPHSLQRCF